MTFKEYAAHCQKTYECTPVDGKHEKEYIVISYFPPVDWMQKEYDSNFPELQASTLRAYITQRVTLPWAVIGLTAHVRGKYKGLPNWNREIGVKYCKDMAACIDYMKNGIHSGHLYDYFNVRAVTFPDAESQEYEDEGN